MKAIAMLKSGFGYTWAALCLAVVLATFVGLSFWQRILADEVGLHVSARFSGGEVRQVIDHGAYETKLHRLVFDGLVSERSEGFVQIDWVPREHQSLPSVIEEEFDLDGDNMAETRVRADTAALKAELLRQGRSVTGLDPLVAADSERILRIRLRSRP